MSPALLPFTRWRVAMRWRLSGRPVPPPHVVKQQLVLRYRRTRGLRTLVETGTFTGEMVSAMRPYFDRIVSIELSPLYHQEAQRRFAGAAGIELLLGDSAALLPRVLDTVHEPALFWLDGHFTGAASARGETDTPIVAELDALLHHPVPGHAVLIDDARMFIGRDGYPTLDELNAQILAVRPHATLRVEGDIICCILDHD